MHYIESGTGTPLVLLHAFPLDARMWNGTRALLEDQFRVIMPDQRGLGESASGDAPESTGSDVDMDALAADVIALLDLLDLNEVILGGCSMGGYVTMAVLRQAPERVAGVVLANTKAEADTDEQAATRRTTADRAEREGIKGWLAENTVPNVLSRTTQDQHPELVASVSEMIASQPPSGVAMAQRAMARRPTSVDTLRGCASPVLVVAGDEDTLVPQEQAQALAAIPAAAELTMLPGVGHLAPMEGPATFAEAVRGWHSTLD